MIEYTVLRIDEQDYGCEELPEGQPVLCDVLLEDRAGARHVQAVPDALLARRDIREGDAVRLDPEQGLVKCGRPAQKEELS